MSAKITTGWENFTGITSNFKKFPIPLHQHVQVHNFKNNSKNYPFRCMKLECMVQKYQVQTKMPNEERGLSLHTSGWSVS